LRVGLPSALRRAPLLRADLGIASTCQHDETQTDDDRTRSEMTI